MLPDDVSALNTAEPAPAPAIVPGPAHDEAAPTEARAGGAVHPGPDAAEELPSGEPVSAGAAPPAETPAAVDGEDQPAGEGEPAPAEEPAPPSNKHWYVVKVQSGREESIKEAIERRVKIEGLEEFFGEIYIPT